MFWTIYSRIYDGLWDQELQRQCISGALDHLAPDLPVIEVGAGTGLATSQLIALGFEPHASEPDPSMRRQFRDRHPDLAISGAMAEELTPTGEASNVLAVNVVHLVDDPLSCVEHLRELAGPEGRVITLCPRARLNIREVVAAMGRTGVSRWHRARFLLLEALLVPILFLSGQTATPVQLDDHPAAFHNELIEGVEELTLIAGAGRRQSAR